MSADKPEEKNERLEVKKSPEAPAKEFVIGASSQQGRWRLMEQAHYLGQDESATELFYRPGEASKSTGKFGIDGLEEQAPRQNVNEIQLAHQIEDHIAEPGATNGGLLDRAARNVRASVEPTSAVIDYSLVQTGDRLFRLGLDYEEERLDTRTPLERLVDLMQAAARRAANPEDWKTWAQGEISKFAGIGAGLNEAKAETKTAVTAGWKALTDGTVVEALSQPNAINAPIFKIVANAIDALGKDSEAVAHAFEVLGKVVMKASEGYSHLPDFEKGKVVGKVMFGMVNPEGSTKGPEAALKVADQVATHIDIAVWSTINETLRSISEMAPDVAQQTKLMLVEYIESKGLTGPQLEAAGIPRGYFDGMQEPIGYRKHDNFFAMSKEDGLEGQGQMLSKAGAGGDWPTIHERPSPDVVRQTKRYSCVSACGEMLSEGSVKQSELIEKLEAPAPTQFLAKALGPGWEGGSIPDYALGKLLISGRSWAAELREPMIQRYARLEPGHTVVVDGLDNVGNIMIRDPAHGTKYEMTHNEFLKVWTGIAVFRK